MGEYFRNYGGGVSIDWVEGHPPSEKEMDVVDAICFLLPEFRRCAFFLLQEAEPHTDAAVRISYPEDAAKPDRLVFELRYDSLAVSLSIGIFRNERLLGTMEYSLAPKEETICQTGSRWVKIGEVGTNTGSLLIVDPGDVIEGAMRELPPYEEVVGLRRSDRVTVAHQVLAEPESSNFVEPSSVLLSFF
jgi:hypothetical protein